MRSHFASLLLVILAPCASAAQLPGARYVVRADDALTVLRVEACFDGPAPPELGPGVEEAGRALRGATSEGRALPVRGGRIDTRGLGDDPCVEYELDVDAVQGSSRFGGRGTDDFVTSAGAFLWRDRRRVPTGGAVVRCDLPEGLHVAAPWPTSAAGYRLDATAFQRPSFVAFGRLSPIVVERQEARVTAVRLGDGWAMDDDALRAWLETAIDGISTVQGRFPVDELLIVLVPQGGRGVGFGMVRRGGGPSVAFYAGRGSSAEDLSGSWVTWHELSHLHLPALPGRDAWLYEGLATYYQEVAAARAGAKPPEEAWRQLAMGFRRGERGHGELPLEDQARTMRETRAYHRVYWAGTAFMLEADVLLRRRGTSLDEILRRAAPRWRGSNARYTSERLMDLLDAELVAAPLRPLRDRYARRVAFPAPEDTLDRLGVVREGRGVSLSDDAPLADVRVAITDR